MRGPSSSEGDLFEHAPCALLSLDSRGCITASNRTLSAWTGHELRSLVGKRFIDLLTAPGRILFETHLFPLLRMSGAFEEVALDMAGTDGGRLTVLVNASERRDAAGNCLSTDVAIFRATERRRYERELVAAQAAARALQKQLAAANASLERRLGDERDLGRLREEFIAVLGHDLRNPLASIRSGARLLGREMSSERAKTILTHVEGSTVRMSGLIDNVLDFARGRLGGGITLEIDGTRSLEPVILQVVDELRYGSGREIVTTFAIDAPLSFDGQRLAQLASNLLGNALTHGAPDQPISIEARTVGERLDISVANGGEPIPPDAMEHLFQPFFRGDVRPSKQGLGLGLHIASEIAKAHGGSLTVLSTPLETRFTFSMPIDAGLNVGSGSGGSVTNSTEHDQFSLA